MICDHPHSILLGQCRNTPTRAPRLVVPSATPYEPGHHPLKRFTTLHFCELHKHELKLDDVLNTRLKRTLEQDAIRYRPVGFKCDFEAAHFDFLLTTTPEYEGFVKRLGSSGILHAALEGRLAG